MPISTSSRALCTQPAWQGKHRAALFIGPEIFFLYINIYLRGKQRLQTRLGLEVKDFRLDSDLTPKDSRLDSDSTPGGPQRLETRLGLEVKRLQTRLRLEIRDS